ncbi:MAG: hypothetical protein O2923_13095 [Verrucomicrobia bacterium]|nr:hypothetical protein [Verrucomicrobiota bacterium]
MQTLSYLSLLVGTWLALAVVYTGVGLLFRRAMCAPDVALRDVVTLPILGWCLTMPLLTAWHQFRPIDEVTLTVITVIGLVGIAMHRRQVSRVVGHAVRSRPGLILVLLIAGFWLANQTAIQHTIYDSGFYHLNAINWIQSYAVVPGLGNLSKMLGFNDSYFLYVALLDQGVFKFKVHHLAGAFLLFMLICRSLTSWWIILRSRERVQLAHVLDAFLLVYILVLSTGVYGSSHSPDLAVYILGFVIGSELLRILESTQHLAAGTDSAAESSDQVSLRFYTLVVLCAVAVTVKLNFFVFGAAACVIALIALIRSPARLDLMKARSLVPAGLTILFIVIFWTLRGIKLTGSIGYPATWVVLPVDWRVPVETAQAYVSEIRAWARQPYGAPAVVMADWKWLWPWFNGLLRAPFEVVTPIAVGAVGAPLLFKLSGRRLSRTELGRPCAFLLLPVAALVFWFLAAPDPRFAGAIFWLFGAGALALVIGRLERRSIITALLLFTILSLTMNFNPIAFVLRWQRDMGPERTGPLKIMTTTSGLQVHVPVEGYQVWRAPLPATPHFNPELRLRVPGDLSKGFTVLPSEKKDESPF